MRRKQSPAEYVHIPEISSPSQCSVTEQSSLPLGNAVLHCFFSFHDPSQPTFRSLSFFFLTVPTQCCVSSCSQPTTWYAFPPLPSRSSFSTSLIFSSLCGVCSDHHFQPIQRFVPGRSSSAMSLICLPGHRGHSTISIAISIQP